MRNVILLADGVTEVTNIVQGSFCWSEQTNTEENLRYGAACAGVIEFACFGTQADAIPEGEELTYIQEDDGGIQTVIGLFYAQPSIPSKNTFKVVAYDSVAKLNADFSAWLSEHQGSFPMTLADLVTQACTTAGVTFDGTFDMGDTSIEAFYADGITCRQILSWAAEIGAYYVYAKEDGKIAFGRYAAAATDISPSASAGTVAYKQGGLDYANYDTDNIDGVAVKPIGVDGAAYMYPLSPSGDNLYIVTDNLLLNNADSETLTDVAQNIYEDRTRLASYVPCTVNIFRSENPFRAGDIVNFTDVQGFSGSFPVMTMKVTDSGATLTATGKKTYESDRGSGVTERLASLSENIVRIDKLKVNWADIDTAIVNYLTANNVTAQNLTIVDENGNTLATYDSNGITLGDPSQTHAELDFNSFELIDKDGNVYLSVGDLRGSDGRADVTCRFIGDGTTTIFGCRPYPANAMLVTVNGTTAIQGQDYSLSYYAGYVNIVFSSPPANDAVILATYKTTNPFYHYDNGTRASGSTVGYYSFVAGLNQEASGTLSAVGGGRDNVAKGNVAYIGGGDGNVADDYSSFVGGGASNEATGSTSVVCGGYNNEASGNDSSVLGGNANVASAPYSSVLGGHGNRSTGEAQTVFGKYNATDNNMAEIVGNGTSNGNRSNARTLDWNGNETLAGDLLLRGGTFDVRSQINGKVDASVETVAKATFLSDTSVFPGTIRVYKQGNVIEFYCAFTASTKPTDGAYTGAVADGYRPSAPYAIFPVFSGSTPYLQIGSMWIYQSGTVAFYGIPNGAGYIRGTYICS